MSIVKTVIVAASLVVVAASAHASFSREELATGYHGNTPVQSSRSR